MFLLGIFIGFALGVIFLNITYMLYFGSLWNKTLGEIQKGRECIEGYTLKFDDIINDISTMFKVKHQPIPKKYCFMTKHN